MNEVYVVLRQGCFGGIYIEGVYSNPDKAHDKCTELKKEYEDFHIWYDISSFE